MYPNPDELKNINFEFIIIAIEDKDIIKKVYEFLMNKGVPRNKWCPFGKPA